MRQNQLFRLIAQNVKLPKIKGLCSYLLTKKEDKVNKLFGKYTLNINIALGSLQKELFINGDNFGKDVQKAVQARLQPGMVALDIGANVGFFTIMMADIVGQSGKIFSFEPIPENYSLLKKNVEENKFSSVTTYKKAISNTNGVAKITKNPINDGGHSLGNLSENPDLSGQDIKKLQIDIETITLDSFIEENNIGKVDFIKMDVEGAEHLVLKGGKKLLSRSDAPVIVCELMERAQKQFGYSAKKLYYDFTALGYKCFSLESNFPQLSEQDIRSHENVFFKK
jgi:FkbM family methyltransferase